MELAAYKDKLKAFITSYFNEEPQLSDTQRCCINIKNNSLSLIAINHHLNVNEILLLDSSRYEDIKSMSKNLYAILNEHGLTLSPVYWLLGPDDYQVNLIEPMPVPKQEFQTALTWRIRGLLPYSVDEAVLEYFELPPKKSGPNLPLIAVVTAQKAHLSHMIYALKEQEIPLIKIDIPEISMYRLTCLHENDEKCTAFLYFFDNFVILNISSQKLLYFTRRLPLSYLNGNTIDYEKLLLEILRYFDFFSSQWRMSTPSRILVASQNHNAADIAKTLSERLQNTVEPFSLQPSLVNETDQREVVQKYLLEYGCLLEQGNKNASPGN